MVVDGSLMTRSRSCGPTDTFQPKNWKYCSLVAAGNEGFSKIPWLALQREQRPGYV